MGLERLEGPTIHAGLTMSVVSSIRAARFPFVSIVSGCVGPGAEDNRSLLSGQCNA